MDIQRTTLFARDYQNEVLKSYLGITTIPRHSYQEALANHGWRLIHSEQVFNPCRSSYTVTRGSQPLIMFYSASRSNLDQVLASGLVSTINRLSTDINQAMVNGEWICTHRAPSESFLSYVSEECECHAKAKVLAVCAILQGFNNDRIWSEQGENVLLLRLETFVYSPDSRTRSGNQWPEYT
jgi:hypothetical protein